MSSGSNDSERTALIALGSNLGDSIRLMREAMDALEGLSVIPIARSSLWRSSPVDCPPGSADFINAAVALAPLPGETPESLLAKLQAMEKEFGRRPKTMHNEARPLDLDLIAFGNETRHGPALVLPHPRAHLRRFVMEPLAELAPDLRLPGQERSIGEVLAALPEQGVRKVL